MNARIAFCVLMVAADAAMPHPAAAQTGDVIKGSSIPQRYVKPLPRDDDNVNAAQDVQVSAFPERYGERMDGAKELVEPLWGQSPSGDQGGREAADQRSGRSTTRRR